MSFRLARLAHRSLYPCTPVTENTVATQMRSVTANTHKSWSKPDRRDLLRYAGCLQTDWKISLGRREARIGLACQTADFVRARRRAAVGNCRPGIRCDSGERRVPGRLKGRCRRTGREGACGDRGINSRHQNSARSRAIVRHRAKRAARPCGIPAAAEAGSTSWPCEGINAKHR